MAGMTFLPGEWQGTGEAQTVWNQRDLDAGPRRQPRPPPPRALLKSHVTRCKRFDWLPGMQWQLDTNLTSLS